MILNKVKAGIALATGILIFAGIVTGDVFLLAKRFSDIETRLAKTENAIKAINVNTPDEKYRELIKELMAEERSADAPKKADATHRFGGSVFPADAGAAASSPSTKPPQ